MLGSAGFAVHGVYLAMQACASTNVKTVLMEFELYTQYV